MKKKSVTLTITVEPGREENHGGYNWAKQEILLPQKASNLESLLAHELGHFMSDFLDTPIAKDLCPKDTSGTLEYIRWASPRIINLEHEAWYFAKLIRPNRINDTFVKECLYTYK